MRLEVPIFNVFYDFELIPSSPWVSFPQMCKDGEGETRRSLGITPALTIHHKTFSMGCTTRKEPGWELVLPRNVILQFQFPGTTEECGNRIHGERLYVANIPKLSKCRNKRSTSWWHRNYKAETIITTHVCFYSPEETRDASTPKIPEQQKK